MAALWSNTISAILLLSEELDFHGHAVRWGLDRLDERVVWWQRSLFPGKQSISYAIDDLGSDLNVSDSTVSIEQASYKAVWCRRGQIPRPAERLSRADRVVARNESKFLLSGLLSVVEARNQGALIVNSGREAPVANAKAHQLAIAQKVGFQIPKTLFSNDPGRIRQFFAECNGEVIVKQHIPFSWRLKDGSLLRPGTQRLDEASLISDFSLAGSPMIYQELIEMPAELRITSFGRSIFALLQHRTTETIRDYVDVRMEIGDVEAYEVPEDLKRLCFAYMDEMNLSYCAFDVAIRGNGGFVFIEANESGQFLFLEERVPQLRVLDAFCQYLASANKRFEYRKPSGIALESFDISRAGIDCRTMINKHMSDPNTVNAFEIADT